MGLLVAVLLLAVGSLCSFSSGKVVARRNYEQYTYYAVEVDLAAAGGAEVLGGQLSAQYAGGVGELDGFHLFAVANGEVERRAAEQRRRRRRRQQQQQQQEQEQEQLSRWQQQQQQEHQAQEHQVQQQQQAQDSENNVNVSDAELVRAEFLSHNAVVWVETQNPTRRLARRSDEPTDIASLFQITDPEFKFQWHLLNNVDGQAGNDHNVSAAWKMGVFGKGSNVCIVDDGIYYNSADIKDNYFAEGSYDFNVHSPDAGPKDSLDRHGTRCAGEIAAVKNSVCGVGIAYEAKVSAARILGGELSQADEAAALNLKYQENHIFSCSWGPTDDGRTMEAPSKLVSEAFVNGVTKGRNGLGSIFVFASGNGGASSDNCNFDGYTNSIYTITVSSIDRFDRHPIYSEECSANMIVMYSSADQRNNDAIATTDWHLGLQGDLCTRNHGGTSAAAPLASGIYALVNSLRPDLGWRDYQHLSVITAVQVSPKDASWFKTASGRMYSHKFGYGKLDAGLILEAAQKWTPVPMQTKLSTEFQAPTSKSGGGGGPIPIPQDKNSDARIAFTVDPHAAIQSSLDTLEHVTVTISITHTRRGDINVDLISPAGIVSHLAVRRVYDADKNGFRNWTMMSVAHWGESVVGVWTVVVTDHDHPEDTGVLEGAQIVFWGSIAAGGKQAGTNGEGASAAAAGTANEVIATAPPKAVVVPNIADAASGAQVATSASSSLDSISNSTAMIPILGAANTNAGIWVAGSFVLILTLSGMLWFLILRKRNQGRGEETVELDGQTFKRLEGGDDYDGDFEE